MRKLSTLCAAWALSCLAAGAGAAIVDCQPVAGRFTVFLSEPSGGLLNEAKTREFLQKLQFELDQNRDGQWVRSPSTDVRFVACFGRAPALDGQDFKPALVDELHTRRVLLEVWGLLGSEPAAGGAAQPSAQMNYLLVPLQQQAALQQQGLPAALQRLRYPEPGAAAVQDPVQLIARPLDIDAFVAAAFGFKLLRERNHELAYSNLCRAHSLLERVARRGLSGRARTDVAELRDFVRLSAGQALSQAFADPRYPATGVLRLQQPEQPCAAKE